MSVRLNCIGAVRDRLWFAVLILTGLLAGSAQGQSGFGGLPEPMSSGDLSRYLDRLDISPQQQIAIDGFHDGYLDEFRGFRDSDQAAFIERVRSMRSVGMSISRAQAEGLVKEYERMMDKVAQMDNRLLDHAQTVLSEEQMRLMPRVRQQRERERLNSGMLRMMQMLNPGSSIDLSALARDADLSALADIDAPTAQYESRLTTDTRKLFGRANELVLDTVEQLETMDLEGAMADPERREQAFDALRGLWDQVQGEMLSSAADLSNRNRRALVTWCGLLPEDDARTLRSRFVGGAYSEIRTRMRSMGRLDTAGRLDTLTPEQESQLEALEDQFYITYDMLTNRMMDVIDARRSARPPFNIFGRVDDVDDGSEEKLADLSKQLARHDEATLAALENILDDEQRVAVATRAAGAGSSEGLGAVNGAIVLSSGGGERVEIASAKLELLESGSRDEFVPGPITRVDLDGYIERLRAAEDETLILRSLHDEYAAAYQQLEDGEVSEIIQAAAQLWTMDEESSQMIPPDNAQIDRLFDMRQRAIEHIQAMDARLFGDMEVVVAEDAGETVSRLRTQRQRAVFSNGPEQDEPSVIGRSGRRGGFSMRGGAIEHTIDLAELWDSVRGELDEPLPNEVAEEVDRSVWKYEETVVEQFRITFESSLRLARAELKRMAAGMRARQQGSDQRWNMFSPDEEELTRKTRESRRRARDRITELNRETRDSLMAALPEEVATDLERAYNRRGYPAVYRDRQSVESPLTDARHLTDLNAQQDEQILALSGDYRREYDRLCEDLMQTQLQIARLEEQSYRDRDWQAFREQAAAAERIRFQREDLNAKTRNRLRAILSPAQAAAVPGLTDDHTGS